MTPYFLIFTFLWRELSSKDKEFWDPSEYLETIWSSANIYIINPVRIYKVHLHENYTLVCIPYLHILRKISLKVILFILIFFLLKEKVSNAKYFNTE